MNHSTSISIYNPATGELLDTVDVTSKQEAQDAVNLSRKAQQEWKHVSFKERAEILLNFRDILIDQAESFATLLTKENGKTLQESLGMEIIPVCDLIGYFANRAEQILAPKAIPLHLLKHRYSYVHYKPRGVVLVISPWNFPFTIPMGEAIMALLAGNSVVIKPSELTPLVLLKTKELLEQAGLPKGLFQVIIGEGDVASAMIDMDVNFVSFTGSAETGRKVAAQAGRNLIEVSLELGGKDPLIVCEDANIERTVNAIVFGAFANSGQICASVERVYAVRNVYDQLVDAIVEKTSKLRQGNPLDNVDVGAMTMERQLDFVEGQIKDAVADGAKVLIGGERPDHLKEHNFLSPTVLINVTDDMRIMHQESFGPVLPIMRVETEQEAIERSNNSPYGLNAYVFTKDRHRGQELAEQLEVGTTIINDVLLTHAAPETPWGGIKESGIGRIHSDDGLRHLCESYHVNYNRLPTFDREFYWYPYSKTAYRRFFQVLTTGFRRGIKNKIQGLFTEH